jgi:hypothetical protein
MRAAIGWLHLGVLGLIAAAPGCGSGANSSGDMGMGFDGAPIPEDSGLGSSFDGGGTPMGNMGNNGRGAEGGLTGSDGSPNTTGDGATDAGNADSGISADSAGSDAADSGQSGDASPNGDAGPNGDGGSSSDASSEADSSSCAGGMTWPASDEGGAGNASGYGTVEFQAATTTQIVELQTTLTVPTQPMSSGTLFLWPGLQPLPNGQNYNPIGEGVLQPVLTWGTSCTQMGVTNPTGWWISGAYVNPYGFSPGHTGCLGGSTIDVQVGDLLDITMSLKGTVWSQLIVDRQNGKMTNFDIDMAGQAQNWGIFRIEEPTSTTPSFDVVFTSSTITFAAADPMACQPTVRGVNDYVAPVQASMDGTKCCISRIILRAQGVPATTPNMP